MCGYGKDSLGLNSEPTCLGYVLVAICVIVFDLY